MKIQFCFNCGSDIIAEFDVAEMPTEEQYKAIEDEIFAAMGEYELENGDYEGFDYWGVCYEATRKNVKIVENRVVKTFYL